MILQRGIRWTERAILALLMVVASVTSAHAVPSTGGSPRAVQSSQTPPQQVGPLREPRQGRTRVITFHPAVPAGQHRAGDCWTESAAVDRAEAWRCVADNEIYDPCFAVAELKEAVVCGADPARNLPGFVLTLTKPLPTRSMPHLAAPLPWMLKLADGSVCELITGTSAQVDGRDVPYECSDSRACTDDRCPYLTGVTTHLQRAAVWKADKVTFRSSRGTVKLLKRQSVAVVVLWQ